MQQYGLIGYPLTHSFSPAYFTNKFAKEGIAAKYDAYPLADIHEFRALIDTHPQLHGLNVTIPYKQEIMPFLNAMDIAAKAIGAVNCIDIRNGILKGYNTDYIGFSESIKPLLHTYHTHALVLGTGGASLAVIYALQQLGIAYTIVSRSKGDVQYEELTGDIIATHKLIINTTPLGMYPAKDTYPHIPYNAIGKQHLLYDLVYNPEQTKFLLMGKEQGAATKNGYEMLILQAEASWRIWNS